MLGSKMVGKLHWEVNSLVVRDDTYFGFGWIFHEEIEIRGVQLTIRFMTGERRSIAASFGKSRDDVSASFAKFTTAKHSGFFLLGSCNQAPGAVGTLFLQVTLEDDSVAELPVTQACITSLGGHEIAGGHVSMRHLAMAFKRGLYLVRRFQIASLFSKARSFIGKRPSSFLAEGKDIQSVLTVGEMINITLMIDHDMGGGANHYRERLVAEKIKDGKTVLIFSYHAPSLSFILLVKSNRKNERYAILGYNFILDMAELVEVKEIIYNTGVTLAHPEELPALIVKLKIRCRAHLILLVHDFFMVCPSHYLLNDAGRYCGIPNIQRCESCLANNQQDFCSLFKSRNIVQWRELWAGVMEIADEVRTFSSDSRNLIRRAYPDLNPPRITVRPHDGTHLKGGCIRPSFTAALRIGVVGQIGYHKGARVIQSLAREIKARKLDTQIVVIGTIEAECESSIVRETGLYQHEKLQALIESSGVNIMLFPSIWPETFSFVVQELMELDLPVACYALGAPAARVSDYAQGLILKEMTASATLDELISFHRRVYLSE